MTDLEPIKARLAAATPGPWEMIARQDEPPEWYTCTESGFPTARIGAVDFPGTEADADLIAHAPTDLAALVAEVEDLRRDVEQLAGDVRYLNAEDVRLGKWLGEAPDPEDVADDVVTYMRWLDRRPVPAPESAQEAGA